MCPATIAGLPGPLRSPTGLANFPSEAFQHCSGRSRTCPGAQRGRETNVTIDYRSELRRPITLALLAALVLALVVAIYQHRRATENREQTRRVLAAEATVRSELERHQRASGALGEVQAKIAAAQ